MVNNSKRNKKGLKKKIIYYKYLQILIITT